eukprot:13888809-Heterocapsa_arctica.AAC.1
MFRGGVSSGAMPSGVMQTSFSSHSRAPKKQARRWQGRAVDERHRETGTGRHATERRRCLQFTLIMVTVLTMYAKMWSCTSMSVSDSC